MSALAHVVRAELSEFVLPLLRPLETARGPIRERAGLILSLWDERGNVARGEAAPLPGFSRDTLEEARHDLRPAVLAQLSDHALRRPDEVGPLLDTFAPGPAARHALDQALLGLLAVRRGTSIGALLHPGARRSIPLHALVSTVDDIRSLGLEKSGVRAVKIKVGAQQTAADVARVRAIRAALPPGVAIRLDANGAYAADEAVELLRQLDGLGVVAIEQPVAPGDPQAMAQVRRAAGISVLADEGVQDLADLEAYLAADAIDGVVLKPMLLGGILRGYRLAERAADAGLGVSVTTTFESAIGRRGALELAAAVPGTLLTSGLDTGRFLARDLEEDSGEASTSAEARSDRWERSEPSPQGLLRSLFGRAG